MFFVFHNIVPLATNNKLARMNATKMKWAMCLHSTRYTPNLCAKYASSTNMNRSMPKKTVAAVRGNELRSLVMRLCLIDAAGNKLSGGFIVATCATTVGSAVGGWVGPPVG